MSCFAITDGECLYEQRSCYLVPMSLSPFSHHLIISMSNVYILFNLYLLSIHFSRSILYLYSFKQSQTLALFRPLSVNCPTFVTLINVSIYILFLPLLFCPLFERSFARTTVILARDLSSAQVEEPFEDNIIQNVETSLSTTRTKI